MEERSSADVDFRRNNDDDDDDDKMIEGYNSSPSSSSSSINGTSLKSHQRKDVDDQLDEDDFERILSRSTARRLLALFEAPEFVQRLRPYDEVVAGGTVTFIAQYRATPTPTVKWFKDEEEVRATERHVLDDDQTNGIIRLTICDVVETDEGAYKCKVENREGVASTTGYLSVAGKRPTRSRSSHNAVVDTASSKTLTTAAGVNTPFYLGPIAEQQSMEEREELELKHQPPSPLQHFIDSIRHSGKAKHAPIYYGTEDFVDDLAGYNGGDDVVNDTSTCRHLTRTDVESTTDSASDVGRSPYHLHAWSTDAVRATEDDLLSTVNDDDKDHRASTRVTISTAGDSERWKSGFQRRKLGQLQLKHRMAIDLTEHSSSATGWTHLEESGITASSVVIRPNDTVTDCLWNNLDAADYQFYIVFVVAVSTLAIAFNVPPIWLILAVASLSLLRFGIDERRHAKPR